MMPNWIGNSTIYPEWIGHFKVDAEPISLPGGGRGWATYQDEMYRLGLEQEDETILEFIVAFVLSR